MAVFIYPPTADLVQRGVAAAGAHDAPRLNAESLGCEGPRAATMGVEVKMSDPAEVFKKVGKLWSVRVGINHRALAVEDGADFIWVWIGPHDEYKRLIKQQG